jgi:Asp-tRNA(Asn)/Glu-tRNA(Gln) amidotransferase A subunit family amidase
MDDAQLDLLYASATEQALLVREREVSPVELVEAHLTRIEERNPALNAFVILKADDARAQALAAEEALARGDSVGPLHGVPFSCKESILSAGDRTTVGSKLIELVAETDATTVARLRGAGAILLGKTNVPDCLACWETDSYVYGRANSAWDPEHTPGGSSGGEAAAISAGLSPLGLGSDGGGSVRVPAHFSGLAGLKGTPSRLPLTGHLPPPGNIICQTACIGPMARRVEDLTLALEVLSGYDLADPGAVPHVRPPSASVEDLEGGRVALFTGDGVNPVDPEIVEAVRQAGGHLEAAGMIVEEVHAPGLERCHEHWYLVLDKVIALLMGELADGDSSAFHPYALDFVRHDFSPIPLLDYVHAWTARDEARVELLRFMEDYPLLLGPPASITAPRHGQRLFELATGTVEWLEAFSVAEAWNVFSFPAASVPVRLSSAGLPIGAQVVGRPWEDELVLAACQAIQDGVGGPYRRPPET